MPETQTIPLLAATVAADVSLCDLQSAQDIVNLIVQNVVGDGAAVAFSAEVIYSASEPTGENFGKLWVKTSGGGSSNPRGVGIVVDGEYVIIPIPADQEEPPQQVPNGLVALYPIGTAPEGWSSIGTTGLPTLPGGTTYQYIQKL